jgi:hypothetical protein
MTKLEMKQTAFNLAVSTIGQNLSFLDAGISAKANELKLSDADYNAFRNDAIAYRSGLLPAYQADQKAQAPAAAKK